VGVGGGEAGGGVVIGQTQWAGTKLFAVRRAQADEAVLEVDGELRLMLALSGYAAAIGQDLNDFLGIEPGALAAALITQAGGQFDIGME
jgi:hypothetical protein